MRLCFVSIVILVGSFTHALCAPNDHHHVVLVVWDGMRPDFINEQNAPTLFGLTKRGVYFPNHHPVYLSATEVNGTAISTGAYPSDDGIIGNSEYRPDLDPLKPIHTEIPAEVRKGDEFTHGRYIRLPTLAEIIRQSNYQAVIAGAKPVALLLDRFPRDSAVSGVNLFAGNSLPLNLAKAIARLYGDFPKESSTSPTRNDWTTSALLIPLWSEGVPEFSFLWMNQPDFAQHQSSPGSPQSLAAIRNADDNLARVINALETKGVLAHTDILVASDHGFSTIGAGVDVADTLKKAGFQVMREFSSTPARGDILVVANSGSSLLYVIGHDEPTVQKLVDFLQSWNSTGVIFTRRALPGTFSLHEAHIDSDDAPDVLISLRWTSEKNKFGVPGMITTDRSSFAPGQGAHVSLSRFDMHNILIAAGPDFRSGITNSLPSGNVDIAPTILNLLQIKRSPGMDGRILTEALVGTHPEQVATRHQLEASSGRWHQYLSVTEVNGVRYVDEGNGSQTR